MLAWASARSSSRSGHAGRLLGGATRRAPRHVCVSRRAAGGAAAAKPQPTVAARPARPPARPQKRKEFEDNARRVGRWNPTIWVKYATWEEQQKDFRRARSVWERALETDYRWVGGCGGCWGWCHRGGGGVCVAGRAQSCAGAAQGRARAPGRRAQAAPPSTLLTTIPLTLNLPSPPTRAQQREPVAQVC